MAVNATDVAKLSEVKKNPSEFYTILMLAQLQLTLYSHYMTVSPSNTGHCSIFLFSCAAVCIIKLLGGDPLEIVEQNFFIGNMLFLMPNEMHQNIEVSNSAAQNTI